MPNKLTVGDCPQLMIAIKGYILGTFIHKSHIPIVVSTLNQFVVPAVKHLTLGGVTHCQFVWRGLYIGGAIISTIIERACTSIFGIELNYFKVIDR